MVQQNLISEASLAEKPVSGEKPTPIVAQCSGSSLELEQDSGSHSEWSGISPSWLPLLKNWNFVTSCENLVKNLGAGQLVREMEPHSEGALREAKLALKMGRFVHFYSPKVEEISQDTASTATFSLL